MVFLQGFFANNKLRNRFVVFLFVLSAAPVIVLGVMIFSFIDRSHRSDVALMAQQTLAQKEEEINAFLSDAASLLSLRVGFEARAEISKTDQEFLLSGFLQENSSIEEVAFINLQGQEVTKKTRSGLPPALESVSTSPYYLKALLGQATIGQILSGSQGTMFVVASPVKNRKNEIIQVLAAKVSTAPIAASVSRARLGQDGYLILLDQAGSVIAGGEQFGLAAGEKFAGNAQVRRLLRPGEVFDGSGGEDRYESDISNTKVVGAGKRLQGPNWILLVEWPVHDADAVLIEIQKQAVWTILVAILFILVAVPVFVNQLILPIRKLKQGAERVQQGDFEYNVDIQTKDELEELGGAFNNMTRGLKRLRELQNEFVYIASHELRIPLTAMRWSLEKLTEELPGALSDVAGKMMAKAREASEHLSQLVDEILLIAKTEAGRLEIQVAPCDLVETVERALSETQPLATERAIRVQYEKPASPLRVFAHEVRLQEVLLNLIGNALKYNHGKGGVRIWHEERGNKVVTHVQDDGIGIPKNEQVHVFEKFFRSELAKRNGIAGTGLGLFVVKEIVERMGGSIWFWSEEGKGSRFSFALPVAS